MGQFRLQRTRVNGLYDFTVGRHYTTNVICRPLRLQGDESLACLSVCLSTGSLTLLMSSALSCSRWRLAFRHIAMRCRYFATPYRTSNSVTKTWNWIPIQFQLLLAQFSPSSSYFYSFRPTLPFSSPFSISSLYSLRSRVRDQILKNVCSKFMFFPRDRRRFKII